jgi:hypothetical protein
MYFKDFVIKSYKKISTLVTPPPLTRLRLLNFFKFMRIFVFKKQRISQSTNLEGKKFKNNMGLSTFFFNEIPPGLPTLSCLKNGSRNEKRIQDK